MDEFSLKPGTAAWAAMTHAAATCCIGLLILTPSFGSSAWCLSELTIMMEASDVYVMPVFLDMAGPQILSTIQDASTHLQSQASADDMERWHAALQGVGNITGRKLDQTNRFSWHPMKKLGSLHLFLTSPGSSAPAALLYLAPQRAFAVS